MYTWQALRPRKPRKMDRTRGSSDSEEEEEEAQREWRDEGKIWNQLGDWAGVACIVVGVSQAERQEKGPGCECCAMSVCIHINTSTQKQKRKKSVCLIIKYLVAHLIVHVSILSIEMFFSRLFTPLGAEESSCSQKEAPPLLSWGQSGG